MRARQAVKAAGAKGKAKAVVPAKTRVLIFGAGKVGTNLARRLKAFAWKWSVVLRPARKGLPAKAIDADVVILALRDRDIEPTARALSEQKLMGHKKAVVLHCAGALGPEVLGPVRSKHVRVAQMHPMISFATPGFCPTLARGQLHVDGDRDAVRMAAGIGRALGMTPRTITGLDRVAYHAAAGLVANGAAALAAGGIVLLERAGVDRKTAAKMLGPLLRSVAENVEDLGLPQALTGPVRRGDAAGIAKHIATLKRLAPELVAFYVAAGRTQLPLARALSEAAPESFDAVESALDGA